MRGAPAPRRTRRSTGLRSDGYDLVTGLVDRRGDRVGGHRLVRLDVIRTAATSTCTPVTPRIFETSSLTTLAQWPHVIPVTQ